MGIFAERLDNLSIETSSPDGRITSVFTPIAQVDVSFRDDGYRGYTERGLERQLSAMADRWWIQYRDARHAAIAEATGQPAVELDRWKTNARRFHAEREATVCEGMSPRHAVFVSGTGLKRWNVVIRDGALAALDEAEFAAELAIAYSEAVRDFQRKLNLLRDKHYPR